MASQVFQWLELPQETERLTTYQVTIALIIKTVIITITIIVITNTIIIILLCRLCL